MRPRHLLAIVALAALALMLAAQPGSVFASHNAARTFVSTTGSDTNPCSAAAPCRTFGVALGHTAPGGEVLALDSGGYGAVTITKSVAIVGAPGAHVAITATSGNAISVAAGASDRVVLRNLYLTGAGATFGVRFSSGAALHIEGLVVSGFNEGITVDNPGSVTETFISDSVVRNNLVGILVCAACTVSSSTGQANATIVRTRVESNGGTGVHATNRSRVVVRDSVSTGNARGFRASAFSGATQMSIEHSTSSQNSDTGVVADQSAGGSAVIDVSNSTITYNGTGVAGPDCERPPCPYGVFSRVNNTLFRNGTNGTFSGSIAAQ